MSVIVPAYNAEPYLAATITSVLAQTWTRWELIVLDDGSTDGTSRVLEAFSDPRIRREPNPKNLGIAATRNRGIELAKGDYIAWLDADDVSLPRRLQVQVEFLEAHPEVVLCSSNVRSMNQRGALISGPWWGTRRQPPMEWELCWTNPVAQSSVMLRAAALTNGAEVYRKAHVPAEDYDLWTRLVLNGRLHRLPEVLVHYRILDGSAFHTRKAHAMEMSALSNASLMEALVGPVPGFQKRLTSFQWSPRVVRDSFAFDALRAWMGSILDQLSRLHRWTKTERQLAERDLERRLFRFCFAPESAPFDQAAVGWFALRGLNWWLELQAKRLLRWVRRSR